MIRARWRLGHESLALVEVQWTTQYCSIQFFCTEASQQDPGICKEEPWPTQCICEISEYAEDWPLIVHSVCLGYACGSVSYTCYSSFPPESGEWRRQVHWTDTFPDIIQGNPFVFIII